MSILDTHDSVMIEDLGSTPTLGAGLTDEQMVAVNRLTERFLAARQGDHQKSIENTPFFYGHPGSRRQSGRGLAGLLHYLTLSFGPSDQKIGEGILALDLRLQRSHLVREPRGINWVKTLARCLHDNQIHWAALSWALADGDTKRRPVLFFSPTYREWRVDLKGHPNRRNVPEEHPVHLPGDFESFKSRLHSGLDAFHVHRGSAAGSWLEDEEGDFTTSTSAPAPAPASGIDPAVFAAAVQAGVLAALAQMKKD